MSRNIDEFYLGQLLLDANETPCRIVQIHKGDGLVIVDFPTTNLTYTEKEFLNKIDWEIFKTLPFSIGSRIRHQSTAELYYIAGINYDERKLIIDDNRSISFDSLEDFVTNISNGSIQVIGEPLFYFKKTPLLNADGSDKVYQTRLEYLFPNRTFIIHYKEIGGKSSDAMEEHLIKGINKGYNIVLPFTEGSYFFTIDNPEPQVVSIQNDLIKVDLGGGNGTEYLPVWEFYLRVMRGFIILGLSPQSANNTNIPNTNQVANVNTNITSNDVIFYKKKATKSDLYNLSNGTLVLISYPISKVILRKLENGTTNNVRFLLPNKDVLELTELEIDRLDITIFPLREGAALIDKRDDEVLIVQKIYVNANDNYEISFWNETKEDWEDLQVIGIINDFTDKFELVKDYLKPERLYVISGETFYYTKETYLNTKGITQIVVDNPTEQKPLVAAQFMQSLIAAGIQECPFQNNTTLSFSDNLQDVYDFKILRSSEVQVGDTLIYTAETILELIDEGEIIVNATDDDRRPDSNVSSYNPENYELKMILNATWTDIYDAPMGSIFSAATNIFRKIGAISDLGEINVQLKNIRSSEILEINGGNYNAVQWIVAPLNEGVEIIAKNLNDKFIIYDIGQQVEFWSTNQSDYRKISIREFIDALAIGTYEFGRDLFKRGTYFINNPRKEIGIINGRSWNGRNDIEVIVEYKPNASMIEAKDLAGMFISREAYISPFQKTDKFIFVKYSTTEDFGFTIEDSKNININSNIFSIDRILKELIGGDMKIAGKDQNVATPTSKMKFIQKNVGIASEFINYQVGSLFYNNKEYKYCRIIQFVGKEVILHYWNDNKTERYALNSQSVDFDYFSLLEGMDIFIKDQNKKIRIQEITSELLYYDFQKVGFDTSLISNLLIQGIRDELIIESNPFAINSLIVVSKTLILKVTDWAYDNGMFYVYMKGQRTRLERAMQNLNNSEFVLCPFQMGDTLSFKGNIRNYIPEFLSDTLVRVGADDFSVENLIERIALGEIIVNKQSVNNQSTTQVVKNTSKTKDVIMSEELLKKKEINEWISLRNVLDETNPEDIISINTTIYEKNKELSKILFEKAEEEVTTESMLDELFEQSFIELSRRYDNVFATEFDDNFAPNGTRSLYNDQINAIIRSPQFKDWFGDWEEAYNLKGLVNYNLKTSVVLNPNGEPRIVWHGTNNPFSYFKFDQFPAAYFAVLKEYSEWFAEAKDPNGGYVYPFFLNVRNPLDLTMFDIEPVAPVDFYATIYIETGLKRDELNMNPIFLDDNLDPQPIWVYLRNNPQFLKTLKEKNLYDGINFYEFIPNLPPTALNYKTEAWIVFEPENIKLADPDRGRLMLTSLKSFILRRGGKIQKFK